MLKVSAQIGDGFLVLIIYNHTTYIKKTTFMTVTQGSNPLTNPSSIEYWLFLNKGQMTVIADKCRTEIVRLQQEIGEYKRREDARCWVREHLRNAVFPQWYK